MKEQIINYLNNQDFLVGVAIGVMFYLILIFLLSKLRKKKKLGLDALLEKVFSINLNIQNSQKENIEAKEKLDELYQTIKEAKEMK